jgi:hypothetical protein
MSIMFFIAVGVVGVLALIWATRGLFSAMLHLCCTLAAGAIAFGLWEPTAMWLLNSQSSDPSSFIVDIAWCAGLLVPFALALTILSATVNAVVRANLIVPSGANLAGGAICGALAGSITVGIFIIGASNLRQQSDWLGYTPVESDANGSLVAKSPMLIPFDRIVAGIYQHASRNALDTETPLSRWRPALAEEGHALRRASEGDFFLRTSIIPNAAKLMARYTIGATGPVQTNQDLLGTSFDGDFKPYSKPILTLDGQTPGPSYVEAYAVQFLAGAKEKGGQIIIGPGQVQLIYETGDGSQSAMALPVAIISQAKGESREVGRWALDAKDILIPSVGGGADPVMVFEFLVPRDDKNPTRPLALMVKGIRLPLVQDDKVVAPKVQFASSRERYDALSSESLMAAMASGGIDFKGEGEKFKVDATAQGNPVRAYKNLPWNLNLAVDNLRGLEVDEKDGNAIVNGEGKFRESELPQRGTSRGLIVDAFSPGDGTSIVQIDVTQGSEFSFSEGESADATGAPRLVDTQGQTYQAIGFVYKDQGLIHVRFTPGTPLTDKSDAPSMSRSRTDQKMFIVFRVSANVQLSKYVIGSKVIKQFEPPVKIEGSQRR